MSSGGVSDTPALQDQRYDEAANASYLHLNEGGGVEYARTIEVSDLLNVDLDDARRVIGIEKVAGRIDAGDLVAVLMRVRWGDS